MSDEQTKLLQQERIRARREAVNAKVQARKAGADEAILAKPEDDKPAGKGEQQIAISRSKLDNMKRAGAESVSLVRIQTDMAENERRIAEEGAREARLQKKTDEAASSDRRNASVQMRWQALYEKQIPQDLLKEIQAQKEACDKIIASKDKLIWECQQELKAKDEEYVKALKKQTEDIDGLISTMHQQTKTIIAAYEEELEEIETAFLQERKELLDSNKEELRLLVEQRRTKENQNREARREKVEEEQAKLHALHESFAEQYNMIKTKLQKEIQGLEQELEEMRALYQLNAEKLEYNLRVLTERVRENEKAIQQHKRKLARLQDVLSGLITKYADTDKRFRHENTIVTEQYRRITEQYKDLQARFQYFVKADTERYQAIWEMNEKEAMELVKRCIEGDRVVFEQQLGTVWRAPSTNFWGSTQRDQDLEQLQAEDAQEEEEDQTLAVSDMAKRMLELLSEQCTFLVEERVRKAIASLESEQRTAVLIESILKALGIETKAEINKLLQYFTTPKEREDGEIMTVLIDPQDAVVALKNFVEYRNKSQMLQTSKKNQMLQLEAKLKDKRQREEREYWNRMAHVIPEPNLRTWDALEKGLEEYVVLLQDRTRLIDETDAIRRQNDQLRSLLNQYMTSPINQELYVDPVLTLAGLTSPSK